jgi:predicted RNase H-like HicB family nuclease
MTMPADNKSSSAADHVQRPDPPKDVPVFNCVVNVAPAGADGIVVARVANLSGIEGRGRSEREALAQVVAAFKIAVAAKVAKGETVPLIEPVPPAAGETQRLIAVHL